MINSKLNRPPETPYANNPRILIQPEDVEFLRCCYDMALELQGVPCEYQYPLKNDYNIHGEQSADAFSEIIHTFVGVEADPKISTLRKIGWVVENSSDLPFLLHVSFSLPGLQKGSKFKISGLYTELPAREFVVERITVPFQAPDHVIVEVIPQYDKKNRGIAEDKAEVEKMLDREELFFVEPTDYRGDVYDLTDE